jgi:hypothetical protein
MKTCTQSKIALPSTIVARVTEVCWLVCQQSQKILSHQTPLFCPANPWLPADDPNSHRHQRRIFPVAIIYLQK